MFGMKGRQGGFIGWLILIVIALALLNYFFDINIFDLASSEKGRATIDYIKNIFSVIWSWIKVPVLFLWDAVLDLIRTRPQA